MGNEVTARVGVTLLIELINSTNRGTAIFNQLGISQSTMTNLARMNVAEIHELAESPFVEYQVNNRSLNLSVQRILNRRQRDDVINRALTLGASRTIMKIYANISSKEFKQRRLNLNMEENARNRPTILNDSEYEKLARHHSKYGQNHPVSENLDHLRCLIYLSEGLTIDINRIYQYFYSEQEALFLSEAYQ